MRYAPIHYDCYLRPQAYTPELELEAKEDLQKLLKKAKEAKVSDRFRFIHFINFYRLNQSLWYRSNANQCTFISC